MPVGNQPQSDDSLNMAMNVSLNAIPHTIDDVRKIQEQIELHTTILEYLMKLRDDTVFRLYREGQDTTASDGTRFLVKEGKRREVIPELVKMKYPELYNNIHKMQKDAFEPKITLQVLDGLDDEQIAEVVVTKNNLPRVEVKKSKEERK